MKNPLIIPLLIFTTTCLLILLSLNNPPKIGPDQIQITRIHQHIFLADHGRQLEIKSKKGALIDKITLQIDPGAGCKAALFKNEKYYIVVDCNGMHYYISNKTGKIVDGKWNWEQEVDGEYIGTYKRSYKTMYYTLEYEADFNPSSLYQYKNPDDPSCRFEFDPYCLRNKPEKEYMYESPDYTERITFQLLNDSIFYLILDENDTRREIFGSYHKKRNNLILKVPKEYFIFSNEKNHKEFNGLKIKVAKEHVLYKGKKLEEYDLAYQKNPDYKAYMKRKKRCGEDWDVRYNFAIPDTLNGGYKHYLRLYNYKKGCDEMIPEFDIRWNYKDTCTTKTPISSVKIYWAPDHIKCDSNHLPEDTEGANFISSW